MQALPTLKSAFDQQRGHLFPWVAVLYASGIGAYFAREAEPSTFLWLAMMSGLALAGALAVRCGPAMRPLALLFLVPALGFCVAALRTEQVAAPKLDFLYYGPVEGRVVAIDRSQSDATRLTLDRVVLQGTSSARTPERVRISLFGDHGLPRPAPGALVGITANLSPPGGPVEPGGYDFQRHAWFLRLGGVGYSRTPVMTLAPPEAGLSLSILRLRFTMADRVRQVLPGEAGGFAAAITTGDRSTLEQDTLETLRLTNLAHLLAISGLHMGLLTGFVFAALRYGLAALPAVSHRLPTKKIAACFALVAGGAYLALSGNSVATERAYVMVVVMFGAVLFDRRAITLRAVAIAALIVLTCRPESLLGPGFQMSFAATTALVATFGWLNRSGGDRFRWPWAVRLLGGVALSSLVAGLATAPIAAAHFNQIPHYGLLANLLCVPLMGLVIIPGAVLAASLSLIGGEAIGLEVMRWPILWILAVAREISTWPGSVSYVISPMPLVLPLLGAAGLIAALLIGRVRVLALPVLALALTLWSGAERPDVLISESGGQVAILRDGERVPSRHRGDGFATRSWLENDGDPASQEEAALRLGWSGEPNLRHAWIDQVKLVHGAGKAGSQAALAHCGTAILVVNRRVEPPETCTIIGPEQLTDTGAVALDIDGDEFRIVRTRRPGIGRRWSQ